MLDDFLIALVFILFGISFVVLNIHILSKMLRKDHPGHVKGLPYECGEPTFGSSFIRFDIRFYAVALVFLVFDVEVVFLAPWAVALRSLVKDGLGLLAFGEAAVFLVIAAAGLAYVWKKGDIEWIPRSLLQAKEAEADRVEGRAAARATKAAAAAEKVGG